MQRAYILAEAELISDPPVTVRTSATADVRHATAGAVVSVPVGTSLADVDRQLIFATLEQCAGVKKHAAEILGISLKTLYNRLEEYAGRGDPTDDDPVHGG